MVKTFAKKKTTCCRHVMASPPLRGSAEWSAKREVAVLLGLTRGNHYAAQQLWLQRERHKAEASQIASAGSPQASQQAAGCQAKPATAGARDVPRAKPKKSAARLWWRRRSRRTAGWSVSNK